MPIRRQYRGPHLSQSLPGRKQCPYKQPGRHPQLHNELLQPLLFHIAQVLPRPHRRRVHRAVELLGHALPLGTVREGARAHVGFAQCSS